MPCARQQQRNTGECCRSRQPTARRHGKVELKQPRSDQPQRRDEEVWRLVERGRSHPQMACTRDIERQGGDQVWLHGRGGYPHSFHAITIHIHQPNESSGHNSISKQFPSPNTHLAYHLVDCARSRLTDTAGTLQRLPRRRYLKNTHGILEERNLVYVHVQ